MLTHLQKKYFLRFITSKIFDEKLIKMLTIFYIKQKESHCAAFCLVVKAYSSRPSCNLDVGLNPGHTKMWMKLNGH